MFAEDVEDPKFGWRKTLEQKMTNGVQCKIWQRAIEGHVLNIVKSETLL